MVRRHGCMGTGLQRGAGREARKRSHAQACAFQPIHCRPSPVPACLPPSASKEGPSRDDSAASGQELWREGGGGGRHSMTREHDSSTQGTTHGADPHKLNSWQRHEPSRQGPAAAAPPVGPWAPFCCHVWPAAVMLLPGLTAPPQPTPPPTHPLGPGSPSRSACPAASRLPPWLSSARPNRLAELNEEESALIAPATTAPFTWRGQ